MAQRVTVTQLKCAVLDPEWRRRWLAGEQPNTFVYSNIGNGQVFGTRFHQETERLAKWLTNPKHLAEGAAIVSVQGLLDILWRSSLQTFTDELLAAGKPDEALDFTARIRNYCQRLIELKKQRKDFDNWQDVFVCTEEQIKGVQLPIGPATVEVVGRVDAVRFHPKYHLEVVDYKLSQGKQQKLDMVQLAIYAHLLPLWRPGCSFCGTLEYYLPNFMEIPVSPNQLADIYVGVVEPVLYEMFAKGSKPAPVTPKSKPAQPTPERDRSHSAAEASAGSDLATKVVAAFGEFNLSVEVMGVVQGPQVTRIKLKPAPGVKVSSLATRAADLRVKLALDATPLIEPGKGFVAIDLPRVDRQTLVLRDYVKEREPDKKSVMTFPVGVGVDGERIVSDFSDSNTCHVLVAGTSGSGKSEWLKTLVASLALGHPSEHIRFALVDPKILTFGGVKDSSFLWKPIATDIESALAILGAAAAEMDSRYHVLARHGQVSLSERFQAGCSTFRLSFLYSTNSPI
jgi:RecB family exonuclease